MSTQINQYLIWGVSVPYSWAKEWEKANEKGEDSFYSSFEGYMDDSSFNAKIVHKDGIFCLFDGRDGEYIIIGRVLAKSSDGEYIATDGPMKMPILTELEQELIRESVKRVFGIEGEFTHWLVTHYR